MYHIFGCIISVSSDEPRSAIRIVNPLDAQAAGTSNLERLCIVNPVEAQNWTLNVC